MTNDKGRQLFSVSSSPSTVTTEEHKDVPGRLVLLPCQCKAATLKIVCRLENVDRDHFNSC